MLHGRGLPPPCKAGFVNNGAGYYFVVERHPLTVPTLLIVAKRKDINLSRSSFSPFAPTHDQTNIRNERLEP